MSACDSLVQVLLEAQRMVKKQHDRMALQPRRRSESGRMSTRSTSHNVYEIDAPGLGVSDASLRELNHLAYPASTFVGREGRGCSRFISEHIGRVDVLF